MSEHAPTILVVEDEPTVRRLLQYSLGKRYRVLVATNGMEALELIQQDPPDLIISDIMMPVMDGYELQRRLQEREPTRAIPFIFLTAKADEHSRRQGIRMGADDYLVKPFDIEELLIRVERLLERTALYRSQLDMRLSQDFSRRLMPEGLPDVPGYRLRLYYDPLQTGGGDLFDWMALEGGRFLFVVGDVMGKGVQAKFYAFSFMSYIRGTLRTLAEGEASPGALLTRLNRILIKDHILQDTFASLLVAILDPVRHELSLANAGHCRPLFYWNGQVWFAQEGNLILGLDPQATYSELRRVLEPGMSVLLYTDALLELPVGAEAQLGEEGLAQAVEAAYRPGVEPRSLVEHILQASPERRFRDDALLLLLERLK
ncbi:MAG: SpoIIE family protein phosphatase [Bacteroidetes bacterium]|nr:SpoIIE family protein phosphatase [Rhodothermia bacterium]MCS7155284.1 SpoIIE family protein phosphatase [Bacteroidota bacterium]MCX7907869.1 SpoIIE family protein phosphatase [Bacteroidota bacterium]MDW8138688.1 SpoIIE family protein phosphatase [Bacteroidota bacterium]MDW8284726.1 SpoIIE family protein phosphatase [Bacteroidota bacterium]